MSNQNTTPGFVTRHFDGGPAIYHFSVNVTPPRGVGLDDLLARASSAADAVTIVERATYSHLGLTGIAVIKIDFRGTNRNEAAETAKRILLDIAHATPCDAERLTLKSECIAL